MRELKIFVIGRIGKRTGADFPFWAQRSQKSLEHIAAVQQLCTRGPTGLIITHRQRVGPVQPFLKH